VGVAAEWSVPAVTATAPGKVILFGEHAVVYGRPAIAVPVDSVHARAVVTANLRTANMRAADVIAPSGRVHLHAPDIGLEADLSDLPDTHPLRVAVQVVLDELGVTRPPAFTLRISSTIPIASGMGSGAAVAVATIRAVAAFLGEALPDEFVAALAYQVERIHHGTPSGIDNTVVAYNQPVYFQREEAGNQIEFIHPAGPFTIVIADTGVRSPTVHTVAGVRRRWQESPETYEAIFDQVGSLVAAAHQALEDGGISMLGMLMDENHALLQQLGVSSAELDSLVAAALQAGAWGAKLSGGGGGGNMIALVGRGEEERVASALLDSGAVSVITTRVVPSENSDRFWDEQHTGEE